MIKGTFSNGLVIAQSAVPELDMLQSVDQRRMRGNQSQLRHDRRQGSNVPQQRQIQQQQPQEKQPIDFAKIKIELDIQGLQFNDQLTKPSYFQAVKQIPLPKKDLEEQIMRQNKEKMSHYAFLAELDQLQIDEKNGESQIRNEAYNSQQKNSGGYFFDMNNSGNKQNGNGLSMDEKRQLEDFMNFALCQDRDVGLEYIKKYPYDTEMQVKEYKKDLKKQKNEAQKIENIQKFQEQTKASDYEAQQYLEKYNNDLFIAVENYNIEVKEKKIKEKVEEFKQITMETEEVARKYINEKDDLVESLKRYQDDQKNQLQHLVQQMKQGTGLSDSEATWYLEACGNDVAAAKKMYNEYR